MGQSMRDIAASGHEPLERDSVFFDADGFRYVVSWDGKRMVHSEQKLDSNGTIVHEKSEEANFVVGAGSHGRSYLIQRGNSLWMSPITSYPQKGKWALSPGYEVHNHHFTRPILPDCLFCHSNRANHQAGTLNSYQRPPFSGLSVGCERCHGPGELHVALREREAPAPGTTDDTIVNPRNLEPELRDDVCRQCHLSGDIRIVRRGRDRYDFRPGLPLYEYLAIFVKRPRAGEAVTVTSHDAQMRSSRCYQASDSKMSCISCHDPHKKPSVAESADYFRKRCQSCHEDTDCNELATKRDATIPADNCLACHMPAIPSDVQHVAITDHRILRKANEIPQQTDQDTRGALALDFYHRERIDLQNPESQRDLAVALMEFLSEHPELVRLEDLEFSRNALKSAIQRDAKDIHAFESLAHAQFSLNQPAEATGTIAAGLQQAPQDESLLAAAVLLAAQSQDWGRAFGYNQQLLACNPHQVRYWQMAAHFALRTQNLQDAERSCVAGLELNPADQDLRQLYVRLLTALNRPDESQKQTEILNRSGTKRETK